MRRTGTPLAALVLPLILLQAVAVPVPRYLVTLTGPGASACCRTFGHCCPAVQPAGGEHVDSCPRGQVAPCGAGASCCAVAQGCNASGACCPAAQVSEQTPAQATAQTSAQAPEHTAAPTSERTTPQEDERAPMSCCVMCQCGIGLLSPPPALPLAFLAALLSLPPADCWTSVDGEPVTPPPEPSVSC